VLGEKTVAKAGTEGCPKRLGAFKKQVTGKMKQGKQKRSESLERRNKPYG